MNTDLSEREIFNKIINFKDAPRTLRWEMGYWGETMHRWYEEGAPLEKTDLDELKANSSIVGPGIPTYCPESEKANSPNTKISSYFKLDSGMNTVPYNYFYHLPFEEEIIYEDDEYIEKYDNLRIRTRELKSKSSMPMWLEFPVKERKDWEKIKEERLTIDNLSKRFT